MAQGRAILAKLTFGLIKPTVDEETLERSRLAEQMRAEGIQQRAHRDENHRPPPPPIAGS